WPPPLPPLPPVPPVPPERVGASFMWTSSRSLLRLPHYEAARQYATLRLPVEAGRGTTMSEAIRGVRPADGRHEDAHEDRGPEHELAGLVMMTARRLRRARMEALRPY